MELWTATVITTLLLSTMVRSQVKPKGDVVALFGQSTELVCQPAVPITTMNWYHKPTGSNRRNVFCPCKERIDRNDPRGWECAVFTDYGEWYLQIPDVKPDDEGIYTCEASGVKFDPPNITLTVEATPNPGINENLVFEEDSIPTLWCNATGIPKPNITWYRTAKWSNRREELLTTGSNMTRIHGISRYDEGDYICNASNRRGWEEKKITVSVTFRPEVEVYETRVEARRNTDVNLLCRVEANPMVEEIRWAIGTERTTVPRTPKYEEFYNVGGDNEKLSRVYHTNFTRLLIRAVEDSEQYWCQARSPSDINPKDEAYVDVVILDD